MGCERKRTVRATAKTELSSTRWGKTGPGQCGRENQKWRFGHAKDAAHWVSRRESGTWGKSHLEIES